MRWAITGSSGQLGRRLVSGLEADTNEVLVRSVSHAECDIAESADVARLFDWPAGAPDVLVNAAAYTAVDKCETEHELADRGNALGPALLAERCRAAGIGFVHVSTDYVFDGAATEPYPEDAPVRPRTAYGRSKARGEALVAEACPDSVIVRTSWVFGPGHNFVHAILRQAKLRRTGEVTGPLRVVDDQRGSPTWAGDLADGLRALASLAHGASSAGQGARVTGLYHLANQGIVTWFEFARAILDETGHESIEIEAIRTEDLSLPAERPRFSGLDCSRAAALGVVLRPWREALVAHLDSPDATALLDGAA